MNNDLLERQKFEVTHSAMWADLVAECDRIIASAIHSILTDVDLEHCTGLIARLQGESKIAKLVKDFPEIWLRRQEKQAGQVK